MFNKLGAPELLILLVVVLILFGAKRLPEMARSFGQSLRILKSETKAMRKDDADVPHTGVHAAELALQSAVDARHAAPEAAEADTHPGVETSAGGAA
ncbi:MULTISPECIES: Sec-independent protein translocase subunit TatA [unclassified Streptomyces]|uniref:Sec-independent protein translocase subunit TatA n=1 Tax=unclassified Streptomyces TaxID=2593676 RepID=UPI003D91B124